MQPQEGADPRGKVSYERGEEESEQKMPPVKLPASQEAIIMIVY